jgi:hypothetical protein
MNNDNNNNRRRSYSQIFDNEDDVNAAAEYERVERRTRSINRQCNVIRSLYPACNMRVHVSSLGAIRGAGLPTADCVL